MTDPRSTVRQRRKRLEEAMSLLRTLGFEHKQSNELAGYTLLALLDLGPVHPWTAATAPKRGIRGIKDFINREYKQDYAENTRESIRDEAVKYFVEAGMLLRNPDDPSRPTNSGNTVYQIEPAALSLARTFGCSDWDRNLTEYLKDRVGIKKELRRERQMARIPVCLPSGEKLTLSPGGQNPLIKAVVEEFCPRFSPGGTVVYIGDTETKFQHYHADYLRKIGVHIESAAKMPDVVVHYSEKDWLLLVEAVTSAGPVDGKRRKELKELFVGFKHGLVLVTAFEDRQTMARFLTQISWETEVWVAEDPDHIVHFNGERFLGPYSDTIQSGK
jgi:hypothetical protein